MGLLIPLVAAIIFSYMLYQKNKRRKINYIIATIFIWFGILFIEPLPDPISVGVWSYFNGIPLESIDFTNLASVAFQYEFWTIAVGFVLVLIGMAIGGWDWKQAVRKVKNGI